MISVFLSLLSLVLWPSLWSILEKCSTYTWKECDPGESSSSFSAVWLLLSLWKLASFTTYSLVAFQGHFCVCVPGAGVHVSVHSPSVVSCPAAGLGIGGGFLHNHVSISLAIFKECGLSIPLCAEAVHSALSSSSGGVALYVDVDSLWDQRCCGASLFTLPLHIRGRLGVHGRGWVQVFSMWLPWTSVLLVLLRLFFLSLNFQQFDYNVPCCSFASLEFTELWICRFLFFFKYFSVSFLLLRLQLHLY